MKTRGCSGAWLETPGSSPILRIFCGSRMQLLIQTLEQQTLAQMQGMCPAEGNICSMESVETVYPETSAGRKFMRAGMGYALGEFVGRQAFFGQFDWTPGFQRLFIMDRFRRRRCYSPANQSHVA
ncbi:MAG: hypothetical protein WDM87_18630 [Terracidiphilus sp.]